MAGRAPTSFLTSLDEDHDPFAVFLAPPPGETSGERAEREAREAEAKRVSDLIDEQLELDRAAMMTKRYAKVLLLGQSESGKSTTLKKFRMRYAYEAWDRERVSWRAVIQLNVIQSIITILDALQAKIDFSRTSPIAAPDAAHAAASPAEHERDTLTSKHQMFKMRLGPLMRAATDLKRRLGADAHDTRLSIIDGSNIAVNEEDGSADEATEIISSCLEDMKALWMDEVVQVVLKARRIRIEDMAGFFLDDLDRIAQRDYIPSDNDIIRAHRPTVGVQEHKIRIHGLSSFSYGGTGTGEDTGNEWIFYEVGGWMDMRRAWLSYFDNVQAMIFHASVSCFDECLSGHSSTNRLEDSLLFWRTVCSSRVFAATNMILVLNKCDLLERKLKAGVLVKKYLSDYGDRANDVNTVVKYLKEKFKRESIEHFQGSRPRYFYATSLYDTTTIPIIIETVKLSIMRDYFVRADLA